MSDFFSFERFVENIPIMLKYLPITFNIVALATFFGLIIGILLAVIRIYKIKLFNQMAIVLVSFILGTPILVQMFIVYYGLPIVFWNIFGININNWNKLFFVIITYSLNQAAFLSEIFRSSILAIPSDQYEAGYSVGLTKVQTFFRIILPQAFRISIPSFSVNMIALFQDTSLAFMIGVVDIMGKAKLLQTSTQHIFECYIIITIIFISISLFIRMLFDFFEKRYRYGR